ncbi:MAG TPA: ABC transporter substrate-binding protein [Streptosporangiaceae bacterium]|jgi:NitT/TauT family transport system substrate-binding protein
MGFPRICRCALTGGAIVAALALTITGCGGSSSSNPAPAGPEKSTINVGILPVADCAQLKLAIDRGFFRAEGLTVRVQILQGGAEAPPRLTSGNLDVSFGAYVPYFMAKASGFPLHIVADGFQSAPGTHTVLVSQDSKIHSVQDLKGKKIGINVKHNLGTLLMQAILQPQGVHLDENKNFVAVAFPNMEIALKSHTVDAVQAVEPFSSQMQKSIGARLLTDLSQGPTANFPVAGYASTDTWAKKYPRTLAAFQRAIVRAQALLADRQVLAQTLPTFTRIDASTAATLHVGAYPTSINTVRLERVVDMMLQYGYLKQRIDVKSVLGASSSG